MKTKIISTLLTLVAMVGFQLTSTVSAQNAVAAPTDEQRADAIARSPVSYWRVYYSFTGVTNRGNTTIVTNVSVSSVMQRVGGYWGFTAMNINGLDLSIDPNNPLRQIPLYTNGYVTNFYLNANGYNDAGQVVRFGGLNMSTLKPSDSIIVTIDLNSVQASVPYKLTGGHNSGNTIIRSDDGRYSGYYDQASQSFIVYFDPLNPPTGWMIIDTRNNTPYDDVAFGGGSTTAAASKGYGIVFVNDGRIAELAMDNYANIYGSLQGLPLDNSVSRNGKAYYSKFVDAYVSLPTDYVQAYVSGLRAGSIVEVDGLQSDGTMHHISDSSVMSGQSQVNIPDVTGYSAYKIVIYGAVSDPIYGATIQMYDTTYPWNTGGVIGKGVVVREF